MKKITIMYKEGDTKYSRGRVVDIGVVPGGAGEHLVEFPDGLASLGPGLLVVKVGGPARRKPKKEQGGTVAGPQGRGGFIETQSGKPRKTRPAGLKKER